MEELGYLLEVILEEIVDEDIITSTELESNLVVVLSLFDEGISFKDFEYPEEKIFWPCGVKKG